MFSKEINLFDNKIYARRVVFEIQKESNLAEVWEYYLLEHESSCGHVSELIRAIYDCGLALLESNDSFTIVQEENQDTLYFTICNVQEINKEKLKDILYKEYKSAIYILEDDKISFRINKTQAVSDVKKPLKTPTIEVEPTFHEDITIDEYEQAVLKAGYKIKISAADFVEGLPDGFEDKVERLRISEDLMDEYIYKLESQFDPNLITVISTELKEYASIIEELYEFKNLAFGIGELANFLQTLDGDIKAENIRVFIALIKATHSDLREWDNSIFDKRQAVDIHYLDSSLMSSCIQIKAIFEDKDIGDSEDEVEFF
jgi:hypothetical protein